MVTGIDLAVDQRGQLWSSAVDYDAPARPAVTEHPLGRGLDLAVAIAVATDPTDDVREFVEAHALPIDRLLVLRPAAGAKDNAVPTAAANALAVGIRDTVRRASKGSPVIHLFLAGPMGLALLLETDPCNPGTPTVVYEDTRDPRTYEAAFTVDA